MEEKGYALLKNLRVELGRGEANGGFAVCFWLYIDKCATYPCPILVQKHPDVTSSIPFLMMDEEKKLTLFPILFSYEESPDPDKSFQWKMVPCVSSEVEFPLTKWVHVGCEVLSDCVRLHLDGTVVGTKPLTFSSDNGSHTDILEKLYLACSDETKDILNGYVHGLDVLSQTPDIKNHYTRDPPVHLSIDHSSTSEIEEDSDGAWNIVGGKASCRRIFSVDVALLDAFGSPVNREFEVVSSLLYADNEAIVEDTTDAEPPLLMSYDGLEYASHDRPCRLINGRASFKLKISQLSSKCDNRLFRIKFDIPKLGRHPFLEVLSLPIRCVSRSKSSRTTTLVSKKASNKNCYINKCGSSNLDDGSMELIPNIVREAKPSPSSKRIKLGNDAPLAMFKEELKQTNKDHTFMGLATDEDNNVRGVSTSQRLENHYGAENNSSCSDNGEETNSGSKSSVSSPLSDLIIFKYCLGGLAERFHLLKEIAVSASKEQLENFAQQVSLFSGCLHHWHQIRMSKGLVEEGIQVWSSIPKNDGHHVPWEHLVFRINEHFLKITCCNRALTYQDFECLRKIAGCQDLVSQEHFEKMWCWLYPVALTLSQNAIGAMWNSTSPVWVEGFITKEEAESALQIPGGLQDPGTFVLRFPTTRNWPHPDAGNLVVTYVGSDYMIHHRLLSLDFLNSSLSNETAAKPLQDLLLEEPELSRLGRIVRNHH